MRLRLLAPLLLASIGLADCRSTDADDSSGAAPEVVEAATITSFNKTAADTWWHYDVQIQGWADRVELHIVEESTGKEPDWTEDHSLIQGAFDAHGAWDSFGIVLPIVLNPNNQMTNRNTACDAADEPLMTWMVAAFSGGYTADCVVAAGSETTTDTWSAYGCR